MKKRVEKKSLYFYTFLMMFLFSIPTYLALNYALEVEFLKKVHLLEKYVKDIENKIYKNKIYAIDDTNINLAFYNSKNEEQSSSLTKTIKSLDYGLKEDYPYIFCKKKLKKNAYDISYMVLQIELNYQKIIIVTSVLFALVLLNIYMINKMIIKTTSQSYEAIQKYTNVFFNDTMHELKTPLGIISLNLDMHTQKSEENKYTKRMKTALKQMQVTYEDIEYYIKNQNIKYTREKIDLTHFLQKRVEFFQDFANSKEIEIITFIEEGIFVFINDIEMQRIIDNNLSNAIKYSAAKKTIEVGLKKHTDSCTLSFKDYGQGIEDTAYIFQRFSREDIVQGGFGIGLNIVQNICNKNDIKISLSSKKDVGSTFTYEIPRYKHKFLDNVEKV